MPFVVNLDRDGEILDREIDSVVLLNGATSPGSGAVFSPKSLKKAFHIVIIGRAVLSIEAANDNTNFFTLFPAIASSGLIADDSPWKNYRANLLSVVPGGSVTVIVSSGA